MAGEQHDDPNARNEIIVTYHGDPEKIPISPVNGAIGGVDPNGEIIIANFFLEQQANPVSGVLPIRDDGTVDLSSEQFLKHSDIQRTFVATFTLTAETARRLADWLVEQANILDHRRASDT